MENNDVLLGFLAVELNFINNETLSAAKEAWSTSKGKSLGKILVELQAISPHTLGVLENLVQFQLTQDASEEADKSARPETVLDLTPATPDNDATPRGDVGILTDSADYGAEAEELVSVPDAALRFRKVKPHAAGALGQVYIARDKELHRKVALKEIKDRYADSPDARSRFLLEAEITGRLEHPGVVPVYGLGHYANGRPFYAMRFIKGQSMAGAIKELHSPKLAPEQRALELHKLLNRFIAVCNTMQYAHDRQIVHRDIKPSNIMLGTYGETLVVDWGLAKVLVKTSLMTSPDASASVFEPFPTSGSSETLPGKAIGTMTYMSPEQAAGRLEGVGPASDVYSLGATLFSILTGRASVEDSMSPDQTRVDLRKLQRKVLEGRIHKPRNLKPEIDRALEAIVVKAMALSPLDRYPNARAMAEDLEKWLAGEPVSAYPEPITEKTRRWVSQHKTFVTGAAAALVVGLGLTLLFTTYLADAYAKMSTHYDELKKEKEATERANKGRDAAIEEEKRAQSRAKEATETITLLKEDVNRARQQADAQKEALNIATAEATKAKDEVTEAKSELAEAGRRAAELEASAQVFRKAAEQEKKIAAQEKKTAAQAKIDADFARTDQVRILAQTKKARTLLGSAFRGLDIEVEQSGIATFRKQLVKRLDKIVKELESDTSDDVEIWSDLRVELRSIVTSLGEKNAGPQLHDDVQDALDLGQKALREGVKDPKKLDVAIDLSAKCMADAQKLKATEVELAADLYRDGFALLLDATREKFSGDKAEIDRVFLKALPNKLEAFHVPVAVYKLGYVARIPHFEYKDVYFTQTIDEANQATDLTAQALKEVQAKPKPTKENWWKETEDRLLHNQFTCLQGYADWRFRETNDAPGGFSAAYIPKLDDCLKRYTQARNVKSAHGEQRKSELTLRIGYTYVNLGHSHGKDMTKKQMEMYQKARQELKQVPEEYRARMEPNARKDLSLIEMALDGLLDKGP